jgi:hypothetical protein
MVSPSGTCGAREHDGAGRPPIDSGLARLEAALEPFVLRLASVTDAERARLLAIDERHELPFCGKGIPSGLSIVRFWPWEKWMELLLGLACLGASFVVAACLLQWLCFVRPSVKAREP